MTTPLSAALGFLIGIGLGWLGHALYRTWMIAKHARCVVCRGLGYYHPGDPADFASFMGP